MKVSIRNMVCNRCILLVTSTFEKQGYPPVSVALGEVTLHETSIDPKALAKIRSDLMDLGFEIIDDKKSATIEKIKNLIIEKIHHTEHFDMKFNWSKVLSNELKLDYGYLSALFSTTTSVTIEHYIISQKIEKVKELLFYDELNMSEIAYRLGYSSVQHLSSQFRKMTGSTPTEFKKVHAGQQVRRNLDSL